ncbi:MAG: hypothetical protein IKL73_00880 [Lachnospiraceae bacterium]|nr:hypothetical protein [Lachnospiraceae bacterium]
MKKKIIIASSILAMITAIVLISLAVRESKRVKVPVGCVYIENGGARFEEGEKMPSVAGYGDKFITNDYIYMVKFNGRYYWDVTVRDVTKETYEPVLGHINDQTEVRISKTFWYCSSLKEKPEIPAEVQVYSWAFENFRN